MESFMDAVDVQSRPGHGTAVTMRKARQTVAAPHEDAADAAPARQDG